MEQAVTTRAKRGVFLSGHVLSDPCPVHPVCGPEMQSGHGRVRADMSPPPVIGLETRFPERDVSGSNGPGPSQSLTQPAVGSGAQRVFFLAQKPCPSGGGRGVCL